MNKELKALLDRLAELTKDELADLKTQLQAAYAEIRAQDINAENAATLAEIADASDTVDTQVAEVEKAEAEIKAKVDELDKKMAPVAEDGNTEGDEEKKDDEAESTEEKKDDEASEDDSTESESSDGEAEVAPEVEITSEVVEEAPAQEKELVTASGKAPLASIKAPKGSEKPAAKKKAAPKIKNVRASAALESRTDIAKAIIDTQKQFGRMTVAGSEKVVVASVEPDYSDDRVLGMDQEKNDALIAAAIEEDKEKAKDAPAITASGISVPATPYYDQASISTADRPVRDALTQFLVPRGAVTFVPPNSIDAYTDAIGLWTAENAANGPDSYSPANKPVLVVPTEEATTVEIDAVTMILQFDNFNARTFPERVAADLEKAQAAHARYAESKLLTEIADGSNHNATAGQQLGALRDLLYTTGVAAVGYRHRHRMADNAVLDLLLPSWALAAAREDLSRGLSYYADSYATADSVIERYFSTRNLRVSTYKDTPSTGGSQLITNQGDSALEDYPDTVQWGLWHPGAWLFLDGGNLDLGVVRDSTLNATNEYQMFVETFEEVAMVGIESLWVEQTICANGAASGTVDPDDFCSGNYVPSV